MIVLDTHAWFWSVNAPERLSEKAAEAIDLADSIAVSAISFWELAFLHHRKRIEFDRSPENWISAALASDDRAHEVPLDRAIAVRAAKLSNDFRGDPADQMILATAEHYAAKLVTRDRALREFAPELTIW